MDALGALNDNLYKQIVSFAAVAAAAAGGSTAQLPVSGSIFIPPFFLPSAMDASRMYLESKAVTVGTKLLEIFV
ncbi:MAG: hypothetical protein R2724_16975 [Bryobacterales bacterium]